jgi:hypothetical protein
MRKLLSIIFFCLSLSFTAQSLEKYVLIDTAMKALKKMQPKGWAISRHGSRIVMTKNDSILVATSYSDYKPGKPLTDFASVKYKYQLFIDFYEADLDFSFRLRQMINDSLERVKKSFDKKSYGKGEYYIHLEAVETLERMKLKDPVQLKHFDVRFSDNCAEDWILYEWKDVEHLPFEPPTKFQRSIREIKTRIAEIFSESGI